MEQRHTTIILLSWVITPIPDEHQYSGTPLIRQPLGGGGLSNIKKGGDARREF